MWGYSRVVDGIEEFVTKMALCFRVKCLVFSVFAVSVSMGVSWHLDMMDCIALFISSTCRLRAHRIAECRWSCLVLSCLVNLIT